MDNLDFLDKFNNCEISNDKIIIKSDSSAVFALVKDKYGFDILKEIAAVDKRDLGTELNYRLYSTENDENVVLTVYSKGTADSVSDLYDSAVADEKEIYDLFGIKFEGNRELKRLYLPESFSGHPLKKDYESNDERLSWNE